jgi:hypothetical protein
MTMNPIDLQEDPLTGTSAGKSLQHNRRKH